MKFLLILALLISASAFAQDLVINGAEFGIGKFHRKDNKVHPYEDDNAWKPFILPEGITAEKLYVQKNSESNYTIFFTNLEEFLAKIVELSERTGKKVAMINLNAHGLPGGMWFPYDAKIKASIECWSWQSAADNSDDANYDQYYSESTKEELLAFEEMSNGPRIPSFSCLTGLPQWTMVVDRVPAIKTVFTDGAQIHMLSCLVGLGTLGDAYTKGIAKLLFGNPVAQQVQTSIKLGLGDWSMGDGMSFWGFESDAQLERDNEIYPVNRRDADIAQRGNIRVAQVENTEVKSGLIVDQEYMLLTHDARPVTFVSEKAAPAPKSKASKGPLSVRIPGTKTFIRVR